MLHDVHVKAAAIGLLVLASMVGACARSMAPIVDTAGRPAARAPDGNTILRRSCTVCHDLGGLGAYADFWGEAQWRSMVETMLTYGAVLTPGEVNVVSAYLTRHFGTERDDRPAGGVPETPANDAMAALLESACTGCHDLSIIKSGPGALSDEDFRTTLGRMVAYGAQISEDEIDPLAAYLARTHGG